MLGVNDFIGYYDWTFEFIRRNFGEDDLRKYWEQAIAKEAIKELYDTIAEDEVLAMVRHWAYSAIGEECDAHICFSGDYFRYDMHSCPSLGFILNANRKFYHDYCSHCVGWIRPMMERAGWHFRHQHNHKGQCWFEYRRKGDTEWSKPGELSGQKDVRLRSDWNEDECDTSQSED